MGFLWFLRYLGCKQTGSMVLQVDSCISAKCPLLMKIFGWNAVKIKCANTENKFSYCGWHLIFTKRTYLKGPINVHFLGEGSAYIGAYVMLETYNEDRQ